MSGKTIATYAIPSLVAGVLLFGGYLVTDPPPAANSQITNGGPAFGKKGDAGNNGSNGSAATIAVGTTVTLSSGSSATVTNVGTSNAAVFNFGIPKGADGNAGILRGTTGNIGGGLLVVGGCTSGTASVVGATAGMVAIASPAGLVNPGSGAQYQARVSANDVVTVTLCALVSLTPPATPYNVAVIP